MDLTEDGDEFERVRGRKKNFRIWLKRRQVWERNKNYVFSCRERRMEASLREREEKISGFG